MIFISEKQVTSGKITLLNLRFNHIRPNYDVKYVIDDRDQVVDMWRSLGLRVLQVAPGNF
jgi:hypothetical protein